MASSQELSRIPSAIMFFLGPVLWRTKHSCLWPLSQGKNKKKNSLEGSGGWQLGKKGAGVISTGPGAWQDRPAQQCPCHQCVGNGQSRTQLRPFVNKHRFRPKCADQRSCGSVPSPWPCRLLCGGRTPVKSSLRNQHSLGFAFQLWSLLLKGLHSSGAKD